MSKRGKHTKRVFAMLLAFIMCLSQAVTAAADEVSDNKTVPETVSNEEVSEEPAAAVSEEAVSGDAEEHAGEEKKDETYHLKYVVSENNKEVIITGHKDGVEASGPLEIPASINGLPVTVIGDGAFGDKLALTGSLTIPDSVKTIGEQAFKGCIGLGEDLTIPDSVKTIGHGAFRGCTGFFRIINNSGESLETDWFIDGNYKFFIDTNGTRIDGHTISTGIYKKVTEDDPTAVALSKTSMNLVIGESENLIAYITPKYTEHNKVKWESSNPEVATVSDGVVTAVNRGSTVIKVTAIDNTNLTASCYVTVNQYGDLFYDVSENGLEVIITGHKDGTSATGNLTIPDKIDGKPVTVISDNAFEDHDKISGNLTIPNSVKTIGKAAFSGCIGLKGNLTIGNNVSIIDDDSFSQCRFTGSLSIPDSVTYIGKFAFTENRYFKNLTIGKNVKIIGENAFCGCDGFTGSLIIPDSVDTIGDAAFASCQLFYKELSLPAGLRSIGNDAFTGWRYISSIRNNSSQSMPVSWFWANDDTSTKCFSDDNNNKLNKQDTFSKGNYVRKKINIDPTGVSLNKTSLEVGVGTSETLKATVSPANSYWDEVSWNSSDKSVATVSDGLVTGIAPGNAVITATLVKNHALSARCIVTVLDKPPVPVTGVTLNKSALGMYPNETETLTATVLPADAVNKSVRWFSSNEKVATVNNGVVTSVSPGNAVITVSTNDGGFTASCNVTVQDKPAPPTPPAPLTDK